MSEEVTSMSDDMIRELPSVKELGEKSPYTYHGNPIYGNGHSIFELIKNRVLLHTGLGWGGFGYKGRGSVAAVKFGDTWVNNADNPGPSDEWPSISLLCLGRLLTKSQTDTDTTYIKAAIAGRVELLDITMDDLIRLRPAEVRKLTKEGAKPPKPGYTLTPGGWHRSGSALLKHKTREESYVMGFDDGQYFGCAIKPGPRNVNQALKALMPAEAKRAKFQRQGEWFFIPRSAKRAPKQQFQFGINEFVLPKDDPSSNSHIVECRELRQDTKGNIFIWNPTVSHDEHPQISMRGWVLVKKNLALRSVSQDGVD